MGYNVDGEWVDDGPTMEELGTQGNQQSENFNANTANADTYEANVNAESAKAAQGNDAAAQDRAYERTQNSQTTPQTIGGSADFGDQPKQNSDDAFNTIKEYSGMMNNMLGLSKSVMTSGVNTEPKGGEESGFMGKLMDGILNPKNANLTNLGANFLAGLMNYKSKGAVTAAQINSMNKNAEANLMNAQTAQEKQNLETAGSKAMGLINMPQAPIKYHNLLAERRTRSGAK